MKLTPVHFRKRYIWANTTNPKLVRFKPETEMILQDKVTCNQPIDVPHRCMSEMFTVLTCLKDNEYEQSNCLDEIKKFNTCNDAAVAELAEMRKYEKTSTLVPGLKKLSGLQMTKLLQQFPSGDK